MVVAPIFAVCVIGTMVVAYFRGEWRLTYDDVRITELSICEGEDPVTGKPHEQTTIVTKEDKVIFVCGNLVSIVPLNLRLYLFYDPSEKPILRVPAYNTEPGYFYQPVSVSANNALGT